MVKLFSSISYNLVRGNLASEITVSASAPDGVGSSLVATAGDRAVSLTWDASAGATSYKVYRSLTNFFGTASEVSESPVATNSTELAFADAEAGELYYFWIVATNAVGNSAESGSDSARPYVTLANSVIANLNTPAGTWILSTLFFGTGGNLPSNCVVGWDGGAQAGVSLGDGTWEDLINGGLFDPPISGAFEFTNSSGVTVTFWNSEP